MIRDEIQQLKTSARDLRKFGLLVGGVFGFVAAWWWWRGKPYASYALIPAVPLLLLGLVWPRGLKWPYLAWMSLALIMGMVVSTILLTIFYYVVVTPVGLLARLVGKDFLSRRLAPEAASYWILRPPNKPKQRQEYEQQF